LRLRRLVCEEGSVYVYESGDVLNFRQIAIVTLALTGSVNVGLVSDITNGFGQGLFDSVLVQAQDPSSTNVLYEAKQVIGTEVIDGKHKGGGVHIPNPDLVPCTAQSNYCDYASSIYRGALNREVQVKLTVLANQTTSYESNTPIGNETAVELPFNALTLDNSITVMRMFAPTFKGAYEANMSYVSAEVTISFDNGEEYSYLRDYVLGDPLFIYVGNIKGAMNELGVTQAKTIRISVLPITLTDFLNNGRGEIPGQQFTAQQATTKRSGEYEETTQNHYENNLGLFKVTNDYSQNSLCGRRESIPAGARDLSVSEGKTPLILVHGWTLLNDYNPRLLFASTAVTNFDIPFVGSFRPDPDLPDAYAKDYYSPAFCYWTTFIENYVANSLSISLDTLKQE
jgi:hypothetical protein